MDTLTLSDAAHIANKKPRSLRNAIERGDLPAHKAGPRAWLVTRSDLEAWINDPAMHKTGVKTKAE